MLSKAAAVGSSLPGSRRSQTCVIGAALVAALSLAALHGLADLRLAWLLAIVGLGTLALRERDAALEMLRKESVELALAAASQLMGENLDQAKDRELVERYLAELGDSSGAQA